MIQQIYSGMQGATVHPLQHSHPGMQLGHAQRLHPRSQHSRYQPHLQPSWGSAESLTPVLVWFMYQKYIQRPSTLYTLLFRSMNPSPPTPNNALGKLHEPHHPTTPNVGLGTLHAPLNHRPYTQSGLGTLHEPLTPLLSNVGLGRLLGELLGPWLVLSARTNIGHLGEGGWYDNDSCPVVQNSAYITSHHIREGRLV